MIKWLKKPQRFRATAAYVLNSRIAQMYATVGNKDKAIEYLKTAIDEHEPDVIYIP